MRKICAKMDLGEVAINRFNSMKTMVKSPEMRFDLRTHPLYALNMTRIDFFLFSELNRMADVMEYAILNT